MDIVTTVISVVYDAISDKYRSIEFGNFRNELKSISEKITEEAKQYTNVVLGDATSMLTEELRQATARINEVLGNSYVIYEGDKILIVDRLPKEDAVNVIRLTVEASDSVETESMAHSIQRGLLMAQWTCKQSMS